ncbi:hypothetical protein HN903_03695 [archaeon]|jgi:hypothetical protein|nr:hypothetical protein [archaeon]MBT7128833.1 hypothetical protein [archaeon]
MKKSVAFLTLFLILFSFSTVAATEGDDCTSDNDCDTDEICEDDECTEEAISDEDKIEEAFECLEERADDCSSLTTQELALTIMATPDNIFDDCVEELEDRESSDHWGNIRDTALAIIALNHAGKDTEPSEDWLLDQTQTPTDLIWYIQQDSNLETECHIAYDSQDFTVTIGEDKKINSNAGSCLSLAQLNFWLQVDTDCYEETFQIECDEDFIASLLYKNSQSSTIYVLDQTLSSPAFGSIELSVDSQCLGESSCEYEATLWGALALLDTDHEVEEFMPYIIASSEANERYLPEAFIYLLTSYEDYANNLVSEQKLGNYWEAKSTPYNKYYDTALALLALTSSSSEQVTEAKDWLLFSQSSNGCWQNSVMETAMVLWALEGKAGRSSSSGGSSVTMCEEADFFCIPESECILGQDVSDNYFCGIGTSICCTDENIKTCSEYSGEVCLENKVCIGNSKRASDTDNCCTGSCEDRAEETECEANFYSCKDTCSDLQEPISTYSCDQGQTCCKTKTTTDEGSVWWIWLLIVLIIAVLIAIGYVYRDNLKLYWFQLRSKFKKDKGNKGTSPKGPGLPPRPGFPPVRRGPMPHQRRPAPNRPTRARAYDRRDKAMSETFRKLRDMSS